MSATVPRLSDPSRNELLILARKTLKSFLAGGEVPAFSTSNPELLARCGAFVSLHRGGELRGCIGQLTSDKELPHTVQHCAICAAVEDSRFQSVQLEELAALTIEISVLTPFQRVTDVKQVEVCRHGLYIVHRGQRGLLLPQVAEQYRWDRETFLSQTCRKAGLSERAWQDPSTEIYTFEAQVFSEAHSASV
jgi:AmmeMemoRadiSam system protein A